MKVLIIGGTGTISEPIARKLADDSRVELYLVKRGIREDGLPEQVIRIQGDVRSNDPHALAELDAKLAAAADPVFDCAISFVVFDEEDAKRTYSLLKGRTRQFIYISTNVVLNHELTCNINEDCETGNIYSQYGIHKRLAEEFFQSVSGEDFPLTVVRPSHTYSKDRLPLGIKGSSSWSVVSRMLRGKPVIVHGDGQGIWPNTHATDFAEWFCPLVGNQEAIGETFQIMNPQPITWDGIYRTLAEELGVEYKPVYISTYLLAASKVYNIHDDILGDKAYSNIFDISKIRSFNPGFEPKVDTRQGVRMYLDYMKDHPEKVEEDPRFDAWCDQVIEKYQKLAEEFMTDI